MVRARQAASAESPGRSPAEGIGTERPDLDTAAIRIREGPPKCIIGAVLALACRRRRPRRAPASLPWDLTSATIWP